MKRRDPVSDIERAMAKIQRSFAGMVESFGKVLDAEAAAAAKRQRQAGRRGRRRAA